jgi:chromosome segregation ATPase
MPRAPNPTPLPALVPAASAAILPADDRPFKPPALAPVPEPPPAGMLAAIRYALSVSMGRWQRRGAIKALTGEIASEQAQLDELLAILGRRTRELGIENRAFAAENAALDEAEKRRADIEQSRSALRDRHAGEQQSFAGLESERQSQVDAVAAALERARHEHASLEVQRKSLRDKRTAIERQQRELARSATQREEQAAKAVGEDAQSGLRRAAEEFRSESAAIEPEREELDHRLADLERPLAQAVAKIESLEAEVAAARRGLSDTRDNHRQHQVGLETDLERRNRELVQVEAEILRRLLSLGTLVNLNRIPRPELDDLYARIDRLRQAIGLRSSEIERLSAEREAHDRAALMRGFAGIGIGATALVLVLVVIVALL